MKTYVNGRLCADVKLETPKQAKKKASEEEGAEAGQKKAALREKFVLDPAYLALFPTVEVEDEGKEIPLRGLSLKYVRVAAEHWKASQVAEELFKLRSADEEADMREEAEETRQKQLSLQPLYAKPPPVWLHPARHVTRARAWAHLLLCCLLLVLCCFAACPLLHRGRRSPPSSPTRSSPARPSSRARCTCRSRC